MSTRFVEGHCDVMIDVARRRALGERSVLATRYLPAFTQGRVGVQFLTVGGDFPLFASDAAGTDHLVEGLQVLDAFHEELDESDGSVGIVLRAPDVDADADVRFVLHWEGGAAITTDLAPLRLAWRLGVRSVGLTWNGANALADGCMTARNAGLTELGLAAIAEMNRLGVVIDVSHLADRGVSEVCEQSVAPPIASHSNARAVHHSPRNLTDDHIRLIGDRGGVVGVCAYPPMLRDEGRPTIADVICHVDHLCSLVGPAHVGVGCDFIDYLHPSWFDSAPLRSFKSQLTREFPEGLETVARLPNLVDALSSAGYPERDVEAIMGGNLRRVLRESLPA